MPAATMAFQTPVASSSRPASLSSYSCVDWSPLIVGGSGAWAGLYFSGSAGGGGGGGGSAFFCCSGSGGGGAFSSVFFATDSPTVGSTLLNPAALFFACSKSKNPPG